jgi:hypothetical protein
VRDKAIRGEAIEEERIGSRGIGEAGENATVGYESPARHPNIGDVALWSPEGAQVNEFIVMMLLRRESDR